MENLQIQKLIDHIKSHGPIHAKDLAEYMDLPLDGNQVKTRALVREAIKQGNIIISSTSSGYKITDDEEEFMKHIDSLRGRINEQQSRIDFLVQNWENRS